MKTQGDDPLRALPRAAPSKTSETPDAAVTEAAIRRVLPAGIVLHYQTIDGYVWDTSASTFDGAGTVTWDQAANQPL